MNKSILEFDLELLSSYLDNQLHPSELESVQKRLETDSIYKDALEDLRRTRLILRSLPQHPAPRNFTISAEVKKKMRNIFNIFQIVRFSSAVAVLGLVVLVVFDFFPIFNQSALSTKHIEVQAPAVAAPAVQPNELPMIITWGAPQMEASGKGGGGDGNIQPDANNSYAILQSTAEPSALRAESPILPDQTIQPGLESTGKTPPEDAQVLPQTKEAEPAISATGPILGIPPSSDRGSILSTLSVNPPLINDEKKDSLGFVELVIGGFALLTGIIAFLLYKKQVS
jgi:hypothetical protein